MWLPLGPLLKQALFGGTLATKAGLVHPFWGYPRTKAGLVPVSLAKPPENKVAGICESLTMSFVSVCSQFGEDMWAGNSSSSRGIHTCAYVNVLAGNGCCCQWLLKPPPPEEARVRLRSFPQKSLVIFGKRATKEWFMFLAAVWSL